jgi:hypothetical protein
MAFNSLPRLATFLVQHLERNIEATGDSNCTICFERMRTDSKNMHGNVVRLPCQHLFHFDCLVKMTEGYTQNRNKCPACREALFELNLLPPAKEALKKKAEVTFYNPNANFRIDSYKELLEYVDDQFDIQRLAPQGREDYAGIPNRVRLIWWTHNCIEATNPICEDHHLGWDLWLELTVAERVRDRLEDANIQDSRAGRKFMDAFRAMEEEMYDEQSSDPDDDDEPEGHPIALEEPASTGVAIRGPEAATEPSSQAVYATSMARLVPYELQSVSPAATSSLDAQSQERYAATIRESQHVPMHFARIRDRLQRDRVIVAELRNVFSAEICDVRTRRVKLSPGEVVGVIRDVDGYSTVGNLTIFWRWK